MRRKHHTLSVGTMWHDREKVIRRFTSEEIGQGRDPAWTLQFIINHNTIKNFVVS